MIEQPVLFLGHGSPMNAIEENDFVYNFRKVGSTLTKPDAVICVSAHWETKGTFVTAMSNPETIHDFGGFPKELYDVQYPVPGSPVLADELVSQLEEFNIVKDLSWGLDHGTWSVLKHLFPLADVPVVQLSLDYTKPALDHFKLASSLKYLREKNILIVGSGNMVHNLRMVNWRHLDTSFAYDWAIEANEIMKASIIQNDFQKLIDFNSQGKSFQLSIPTSEHFLPLIYILALKDEDDKLEFFNDDIVGGSISMTSVRLSGK